MKCCKCKHNENYMYEDGAYNECNLLGFSYYQEFYECDCPYINDNYELTEEGKEAKEIF